MDNAYKVGALAVRERWSMVKPDALAALDATTSEEIAIFAGSFDSVQNVFTHLEKDYSFAPSSLEGARICFENCPGDDDAKHLEELRSFVEAGGWLVTSDWALKNVVEKAFPNTVRWNKASTGDEVIGVEPMLATLWDEVTVPGVEPQWWLEGASYGIEVLDPERVEVVAASHEMLVKYNAPVVAVRFDWGQGHVFHIVSHFWLKRSRAPGVRHRGPASDFMRQGMGLSEEQVASVFDRARVKPGEVNFASIQSAVTSIELVAGLCVQSARSQTSSRA